MAGLDIACLPDFMVRQAVATGELLPVLDKYIDHQGTFRLLWPTSKYLSPRIRAFINFMVRTLFEKKDTNRQVQ